MIERYEYNGLTWIDVLNPTTDEIRAIIKECDIPLEFSGDLTSMVPRSEVHAKKQTLKITLDFPIVKRTDINHPHEIKFIATKKHLITVRFEDIEALHRFSKDFEIASLLKHSQKKQLTGAHIMLSLLDELYRTMTMQLDYLESKMTDIEEEMFQEREREMVLEISKISRRLISFRQTLHAHETALLELECKIVEAFGKTLDHKVAALQSEYEHHIRRIDALGSTLEDLRDTNNSLVSTKQNEIMKTLTIMAFITFPLSLFTSMFGMNTIATPIIGQRGDFWIIVSIMIIVSIGFFIYFKYKKWM